jgi:hypothetical protein
VVLEWQAHVQKLVTGKARKTKQKAVAEAKVIEVNHG